jgi:outer membrane receptor protein involved in Fe transport
MTDETRPVRSAALAAAVALSLAGPAGAQEKPARDTEGAPVEEVVVTGSRIARPDLERLEQTSVLSSASLDERGYTDIGQALSEIPGFGVLTNGSNVQSNFGIGQSFVDLFSLGSQRTLTLVNGRRFVSSNSPAVGGVAAPGGQVDLNNINTKLIDRVETVSVGGAPIYGADAISGTVNIILKRDYEGFDVDAQYGRSGFHDADNKRIRALWGKNFASGRGNITLSGEFTKQNGLLGTDRPVYAADYSFLKPSTPVVPYTQVLVSGMTVTAINYGGVPLVDDFFFAPGIGLPASVYGVQNSSGQTLAFGNAGKSGSALVPYNLGTFYNNPVFSTNGDGERLSQVTNLLSPSERYNLNALGSFQITDSVRAFGEAWFSHAKATSLIAQPQYNTFFFGSARQPQGNLYLSVNNPYLPADARAAILQALAAYQASNYGGAGAPFDSSWDGQHFYMARASTDLQSGGASGKQDVYRVVLGLDGKFEFANRSFNWEIAGTYGHSKNTSDAPQLIWQNFQNAVDTAIDPATGQIVCAGSLTGTIQNAPTSSVSSTCAPLNPFGNGSPSQAARDYVTHHAIATSISTQRDVTATIGADLFHLPAGEVKASLGFENRRETASFAPDDFYTNALGTSAAILGISGSYRTNELFGELLVPIFAPAQNIPFLHSMQLEGAVRRVDNSIAGNSTTWTGGLRWSPTEDVQFRGNKTSSIRAPAVTELFLPSVPSYSFANDPCDVNFIGQGNDPATRAKNCAAEGIPAGFTSNVVNATALGTTAGNSKLTSETADAKSIGFVLRPRWVPRLNVTVDYVDIRVTNAIENLDLTTIMQSCYDSTNYPNNPYCALFQRNAQHQVVNFQSGYVNAGNLHFTGIVAGLDYSFDVPTFGHRDPGSLGNVTLRANYLDTQRLTQQIGSVPLQKLDGQIGGTQNVIKSKGTLDLAYRKGGFGWSWQGRFFGPANFSNTNPTDYQDYMGVSHWWVLNSTLSYEFPHQVTARLIVDNVTNKLPPFPAIAGSGGNYTQSVSIYWQGVMGRYFTLGVDAHF